MSKEITTIKHYDIAKPEQVKGMAIVLQQFVNKNKLSVEIQGKPYCMCEGWQFCGMLSGLDCRVIEEVDLSKEGEVKWKATAVIFNKGGEMVGRGVAICSNKESKKRSFDEYAILSMAQTRAIAKAYRNKLGWVMKMAGFESMPAEEIKTPEKDVYAEAKKMIEAARTSANVITISERIEKSAKFTAEQKKELTKLCSDKVDALDSQDEKKHSKK